MQGREDLWGLLITIMARKAGALKQRQAAEKRGGGLVRGDSVFDAVTIEHAAGFDGVKDPGEAAGFVDDLPGECRERLQSLPDPTLHKIALRRMEGYEISEIAVELGVAVATIKRKLGRIRQLWADKMV